MSHTQTPLMTYVERAYFDYARYVIHDRALPFIGDGLKPVARRIVYAMSELSLHAGAKHKKSARTIGDVLGKFHPHGDAACYEAMVLMAQSFSYRYPLIDGQGNWGSIDEPKSFAAMRYTEARLSEYAQSLLKELGPHTVLWTENFDGSLKEPSYLAARLPNVLLNGSMGIAVGLSTDIPPHNIHECVEALITLIHDPHCDDRALLASILGPDLPTGGVLITPREEMIETYLEGSGNYRVRATYELAPKQIILTSLPYQVSTSRLMKQIADLVLSKKLVGIEDIRDDSDEAHPVRIILMLKNNASSEQLLALLFAHTDCEKSYRIQQFVLNMQHKPELMSLPRLLRHWLEFRMALVRRRLTSDIEALDARLHLLDGLKIIAMHLDEVIHIIRYDDDPEATLAARFSLSAIQTKAILEIRLKQLTKVEWLVLDKEYQEKSEARAALALCLSDEIHFNALLERELREDAQRFGNPRRTHIQPLTHKMPVPTLKAAIPTEAVKIFLSQEHWIRSSRNPRMSQEQLMYLSGDQAYLETVGSTDQSLLLLNARGQSYTLSPHLLPSVRGKGDPLSQWLESPHPIIQLTLVDPDNSLLCLSTDGYGFIVTAEHAKSRLKNGKLLMSIPEQEQAHNMLLLSAEHSHLALLSTQGQLLILDCAELPVLKKGRGLKLIQLRQAQLADAQLLTPQSMLILRKQEQTWEQSPALWKKHIGKRGSKGNLVPRHFRQDARFESSTLTPEASNTPPEEGT